MKNVLIIGCGYSGRRVAALHVARGDRVFATSRREKCDVAAVQGIPLDLDAGEYPALPAADRLYYTAPPPDSGHEDSRLAGLLAVLPAPAEFIYFGTTAVYGDRAGEVVFEDSPVEPADARARRRANAEQQVTSWAAQRNVVASCLRIAGIYGPDRLPLSRLRAGDPVPDPADTGPGNRIHVDDLAAAAVAVADSRRGGFWNICDGNPLSTAEFNDRVAEAAGLPQPRRVPLDSSEISPGMRRFLAATRRVDNRKLLSLPGFSLRYADPADGILDSLGM